MTHDEYTHRIMMINMITDPKARAAARDRFENPPGSSVFARDARGWPLRPRPYVDVDFGALENVVLAAALLASVCAKDEGAGCAIRAVVIKGTIDV